ncbi:MAG: hypothetical protein ACQKBT_01360, partial [Puniceicoccales bacterium]
MPITKPKITVSITITIEPIGVPNPIGPGYIFSRTLMTKHNGSFLEPIGIACDSFSDQNGSGRIFNH